jgi:peptide chain release factor 1
MFDKLVELEEKYHEIERKISDPEVISNHSEYQKLLKKHSDLKDFIQTYNKYKNTNNELEGVQELLKDPEMKDMAEQEASQLKAELEKLKAELQIFLIPKDPDDNKNAIVEIRSGTGGEEAALFAHSLFRMYTKYAEQKKWTVEILSENITGLGGIKEIVFVLSGISVYGKMKFESGTHRVQRVPETESSGRLHTSAATVAILPEAGDIDVEIDQKDLRIDTFRASGAGGQHVNKTSSAVRITHIPTNVVVACQDERSQFQNKDKAMRILRTKLYEQQKLQQSSSAASIRKIQVGSGDRSEKIRTYNYPQNRVSDHRINLTLYSLDEILSGKMDAVFNALISADTIAKLKQ